jgi:hypothetical protein
MTLPGVVGVWSVKDSLAHLAAWERFFLRWYEAGRNREPLEPAPVALSRNAIAALNEQIYEQNERSSLAAVNAEFHASYVAILAALQVMPEDDMFTTGHYDWTGKLRVADYIAGNTCNHYRWATSHIRRWSKTRPASLPYRGFASP